MRPCQWLAQAAVRKSHAAAVPVTGRAHLLLHMGLHARCSIDLLSQEPRDVAEQSLPTLRAEKLTLKIRTDEKSVSVSVSLERINSKLIQKCKCTWGGCQLDVT